MQNPYARYMAARLASSGSTDAGLGVAAMSSDDMVLDMALRDKARELFNEEGEDVMYEELFPVGESVFIMTDTMYWVGVVAKVKGIIVVLDKCSWVHWTGRTGVFMTGRKFTGFSGSDRTPRSEYVGDGILINLLEMRSGSVGGWETPTKTIES